MKVKTVKKMIMLAEGFSYNKSLEAFYSQGSTWIYFKHIQAWEFYPILLYRALQGLNPQWYEWTIESDHIDMTRMNPDDNYKVVWNTMCFYEHYQKTDYLTAQEQAIEASLIELLEEK